MRGSGVLGRVHCSERELLDVGHRPGARKLSMKCAGPAGIDRGRALRLPLNSSEAGATGSKAGATERTPRLPSLRLPCDLGINAGLSLAQQLKLPPPKFTNTSFKNEPIHHRNQARPLTDELRKRRSVVGRPGSVSMGQRRRHHRSISRPPVGSNSTYPHASLADGYYGLYRRLRRRSPQLAPLACELRHGRRVQADTQ